MKIILISLFVLLYSGAVSAQAQWTYAMYASVDYTNFRQNSLFLQNCDLENPDIPLLNAALFFMVNEERSKKNIYLLEYMPALEIAAYNHSLKMVETDFFSHSNPKDTKRATTTDRGKLAGVSNPSFAENIAYNNLNKSDSYLDVADRLLNQWMNSPGHRSNILSDRALQAGCGTYISGNTIHATQVFQWFSKIRLQDAVDGLPKLKFEN